MRNKTIAIIVLAVAWLCVVAKLAGQSFGSFLHDQPYLVPPVVKEQSPDLLQMDSIAYWWHGADVSGNVSSWTNRASNYVSSWYSPNGNLGTATNPIATNAYVEFTGESALTNAEIAYNWTADMNNHRETIIWVINFLKGDQNPILTSASYDFSGWYILQGVFNLPTLYDWEDGNSVTFQSNGNPMPTNEIMDIVLVKTNQTGSRYVYTNGVLSAVMLNRDSVFYGVSNVVMGYLKKYPWYGKFRIYDFMAYSNSFSAAGVSNFHYWRTNTYNTNN